MKMAPIPPTRSRFASLAPANIRAFLNQHSRIVNAITVVILVLVIANMAGWMRPLKAFFSAPRHHDVAHHGVIILNVKNLHCPALYITAMVSDGRGGAYVASDDSGIYHYQPNASSPWTHYDKANSQGLVSNHIYSLCLDAKGRLWVGTLRHGVCVFNGVQWKHYGLLNGPLGCHVVAIVSDPYDHSVWMCTEAGVSIYETSTHQWRYLPQAMSGKSQDLFSNGLPPNPDCVAFNKQGVAFVGTQCHGLAIGYPPYKSWSTVTGPWKMPRTAFGYGLPCNLINAVVVGKDGRIYVGTDEGLAWNNPGNPYVFQYERGRDYIAKVKGLWHPPRVVHKPPRKVLAYLLPGDHVTCLAVDPLGQLWLGTWRSGMWFNSLGHGNSGQGPVTEMTPKIRYSDAILTAHQQWEIKKGKWRKAGLVHAHSSDPIAIPGLKLHQLYAESLKRLYISAIVPLKGGGLLVGHYGTGVSVGRVTGMAETRWERAANAARSWIDAMLPGRHWHPSMPDIAKPPTRPQLAALVSSLAGTLEHTPPAQLRVISLDDDWRTEGNWLGRYGKFWIDLCGMWRYHSEHRYGLLWGYGVPWVRFLFQVERPYDAVRAQITNLSTASPDSLQLPLPFYTLESLKRGLSDQLQRRQAENDDHGEVYSTFKQGPGLSIALTVPRGWTVLSLYDYNNDAHQRTESPLRDYPVCVYEKPYSSRGCNLSSRNLTSGRSPRTRGRFVNFAGGGVWKRFLVHGPADVVIRINRNHSTNTIIGAIALDWAMGRPPPYFMTVKEWWRHEQGRHSLVTRELAQIRSGVYSATSLRKASALSLCADWVGLLRLQRWIDPVGWAARGEESYCLIDRRITRKQRDLKQATTVAVECNYRLCRFRQYEAGLLRLGLPIPRKMERKLRWTGHFRVFRNGGYSQLAQIAAGGPTGNGS